MVGDNPDEFLLINLNNVPVGEYVGPVTGTGEFGPFPANMTRRNAFRGPGFWNVDLGLYKNFGITENTRLQLRAEFFNAFNHANMFVVGSSADLSNCVQIGGNCTTGITGQKFGRRNVQLAAKFLF